MSDPWSDFRNLCSYYIDCVKYSEKRQEYLFLDQLNNSFMLPALGYNWHREQEIDIQTSLEERYIREVLLIAEDSDELFIGYPLSSFISTKGVHCLSPIMLFPVKVSTLGQGSTTGLRITIDRKGIDLNQEWLEYNIPRDQQVRFVRACERVTDSEGCLDVEIALQFMSNHFHQSLDPNRMDFSLRHPGNSRNTLLNTAVLFVGASTKYTRTLIKELNQIQCEPDVVLDQTALAYVFRNPPLEIKKTSDEEKRVPVLFTKNPLNDGQYRAVEEALNNPVSKVTGPPGTGKSHMSVNLIANEVFNGGSVLFTSKNHKAIHAVWEMCQENNPGNGFDFVAFSTIPGNESVYQWDKMQDEIANKQALVKDHLNKCGKIGLLADGTDIPYSALDSIEQARDEFRDASVICQRYEEYRKRVSNFERYIEELDDYLSGWREEIRKDPKKVKDFLELWTKYECTTKPDSAWIRLLGWLKRILLVQKEGPDVIKQLKEIAPELAKAYLRPSTVKKHVRKLLHAINIREKLEELRKSEQDVVRQEESENNYETLKNGLKEAYEKILKYSKAAYLDFVCQRVNGMDNDDLLNRMKDAVNELYKHEPLPFMTQFPETRKFDEVLRLFKEFHKIFPAWGVTLLSLKKASPCVPGVFSLVLIDEASQCETPPMIPALFRAKRVAVVGDSEQFPPVITMKKNRDEHLCKAYGIERRFMFSSNSVFSVIPRFGPEIINLVDHFRCMDEIAMYFNEEFYKSSLCPCVGNREDQGYHSYGLKPGMMFIDAPGGDSEEIDKAIEYLKEHQSFTGSVGVISPLRKLANRMKTICADQRGELPKGLTDERINTANGFQGGQCDIIVFLLGLNEDRTHGEEWYITGKENRYIFNVSVSRAKVCFVAIGDKRRAEDSGLSYIQKLIPRERNQKNVKVGKGEIVLRDALMKAGISTKQQYPICGRYLDLAIDDKNRNIKIDIEVDGQAYHLDRNGCRKSDDIHRDLLMEINGWKVLRFWHHEVMMDIGACVQKVQDAIKDCTDNKKRGMDAG